MSNLQLPTPGDAFEFDYTFRDEKTEVIPLIVVDVTDTHVMYKMPTVSVNKIFPMTHEVWILNEDDRREATTRTDAELTA